MYQMAEDSIQRSPDVLEFVETVRAFRNLFSAGSDVYITRAPGRLDVMGGIGDYSGSHVLEMPIGEAALAGVQKDNERLVKIVSLGSHTNTRTYSFEMPLEAFESDGEPVSYEEAKQYFRRKRSSRWAAYIAGTFLVLMKEKGVTFRGGARILIDSRVSLGKGVSSSAAIEVAAMTAIAAAFEIDIEPKELAVLCQKVENLIVGAPCGIMDQMTSVKGEKNKFLSLVCQPAELRGTVSVPDGIAFWGIDSGIRHSVGGGDYGSVRTGAFMGYRIIADLAGLTVSTTGKNGFVKIADDKWRGYLANIMPQEFEEKYAGRLPKEISGSDFLQRYQGINDTVTSVSRAKKYAVLSPTRHPVYENGRVNSFVGLLQQPITDESLRSLGNLMCEAHKSYSDCGLGTSETDLLVDLVMRSKNLFGAKITGGGCGGTVAVLGRKRADAEIAKVAADYENQTGHRPHIFTGSSMGAETFGHLRIKLI